MAGRRMGKLSLCDDCHGLHVYYSRAHYCTDGLPYYFVVVFQVVNEHIYCIFALYTCMSMCCKHYYTIEYYCACYSHVPDTTVMRFLCICYLCTSTDTYTAMLLYRYPIVAAKIDLLYPLYQSQCWLLGLLSVPWCPNVSQQQMADHAQSQVNRARNRPLKLFSIWFGVL